MAALAGGQALGKAGLPASLLIVAFIGVTVLFNLFVGSMSAKYAMFAPIFIPMFMLVGISPELTRAAYRIGDSVSNIITPLNAYLVIVLVFLKKEMPRAGMGTLISTMLPYTVVFTIVWTIMLVVWMALGLPLGIGGPLGTSCPAEGPRRAVRSGGWVRAVAPAPSRAPRGLDGGGALAAGRPRMGVETGTAWPSRETDP